MMQLSGVRILNGSFPVSGSLSGVWFREGFVPRPRIFFVEGLRSSGFRVKVLVLITASTTAFHRFQSRSTIPRPTPPPTIAPPTTATVAWAATEALRQLLSFWHVLTAAKFKTF